MIHPTPNRLVRHRHSAFRQQIFDVAQAQGEPEVKPYRLLNDLRRETIPAVAELVHPRAATRPPRTPQARRAVTMPSCSLRVEGARDVVEPAELEDRELVLEGRQDLVGDALRPIDGFPGDEARALQQPVFSDVDVDQNGVDAVERRTAVETERQHLSSKSPPSAAAAFRE